MQEFVSSLGTETVRVGGGVKMDSDLVTIIYSAAPFSASGQTSNAPLHLACRSFDYELMMAKRL